MKMLKLAAIVSALCWVASASALTSNSEEGARLSDLLQVREAFLLERLKLNSARAYRFLEQAEKQKGQQIERNWAFVPMTLNFRFAGGRGFRVQHMRMALDDKETFSIPVVETDWERANLSWLSLQVPAVPVGGRLMSLRLELESQNHGRLIRSTTENKISETATPIFIDPTVKKLNFIVLLDSFDPTVPHLAQVELKLLPEDVEEP